MALTTVQFYANIFGALYLSPKEYILLIHLDLGVRRETTLLSQLLTFSLA